MNVRMPKMPILPLKLVAMATSTSPETLFSADLLASTEKIKNKAGRKTPLQYNKPGLTHT